MCVFIHVTCPYIICLFFVSCKMINNIRTISDPAYVADGRSSNYFISNALQSSFYARAAFLEPVLKLIIKGRHFPSTARDPRWVCCSLSLGKGRSTKIVFVVSQSRELNTSELISLEHQYRLNVGFGTFWMQGENLNESASTSLYSFCFKQE